MKNVLLVCSAGMSTSLLVSKMQQAADEKGIECNIQAVGESEVKDYIDSADVLLLGPQVRFLLSKFKKSLADKNIEVEVINTVHYGTMNGEKVLERALELMENK
ncbi:MULTISPECIES: PTS sugar transporter subunit IIB [unclassified Clostridium]|uniref:PTS sugar transporter subunit IIB n=1 Tax=unclassified Clostridium TaxID=2614128 RepID=UPI00029832EE|nr:MULTISPECIES: PTS sugar transporter subunit IIB [unclassified Clostridium]EKQ56512.1 MAG: PTS system, lactose/cellobiose family IIB component [Clostridium sp. Maddingley MBC34-26]